MAKKKKLRLQRNLLAHHRFFHKHPPEGDVFFSRCADIYCLRNITPSRLLPRKKGQGALKQLTCGQSVGIWLYRSILAIRGKNEVWFNLYARSHLVGGLVLFLFENQGH